MASPSLPLLLALFAALLSCARAVYVYTPVADNQPTGAVFYYDNTFCEGVPVLVTTRYMDYVSVLTSSDIASSCEKTSQCGLNSAAQPAGTCQYQVVKIGLFNSSHFVSSVGTELTDPNSDGMGAYNDPEDNLLALDGCYSSRSYANCYFSFVPVADVNTSSSSTIIASLFLSAFSFVFGALLAC